MDRHKEYGKIKLEQEMAAKMKTIMIGALSSIEEKLGVLWGFKEKRPLTRQEQDMEQIYADLRKEILDKGNTQVRNMREYINLFDVDYIGYNLTIKLPVRRKEAE